MFSFLFPLQLSGMKACHWEHTCTRPTWIPHNQTQTGDISRGCPDPSPCPAAGTWPTTVAAYPHIFNQCLLSLLAGDILYLPCLILLKDWLHEAWALINWFSLTQLVRTSLWQPCKGCTMESLDPFVWFTSLLQWFNCTAHCTIQH